MDGYYAKDGKSCLRADSNLYSGKYIHNGYCRIMLHIQFMQSACVSSLEFELEPIAFTCNTNVIMLTVCCAVWTNYTLSVSIAFNYSNCSPLSLIL